MELLRLSFCLCHCTDILLCTDGISYIVQIFYYTTGWPLSKKIYVQQFNSLSTLRNSNCVCVRASNLVDHEVFTPQLLCYL